MSGLILLTGAAGKIGSVIRPWLLQKYEQVKLSDVTIINDLHPGESFELCQLGDEIAVDRIMEGVSVLVHFGGISCESSWPDILESNIRGSINIFESARKHRVSRIVYASSNHVMGFYERTELIGADRTPRPDSRYGVSKAFGESLAAMYADKYGIKITCLRIGNVEHQPIDRRRLSIWIHPEDLFQLICIGIDHPSIRFEILYGMSENARAWWTDPRATALGYAPRHRSEDHAARVLLDPHTPDPIADEYQGGSFCAEEYIPR
jgi:uronate dehydrogenase